METLPVITIGPLPSMKVELLPFCGVPVSRSTKGALSFTSSVKISTVNLTSKAPSEILTVTNRMEGSGSGSVLVYLRVRSNSVASSGARALEYSSVSPLFMVFEGGVARDIDPI